MGPFEIIEKINKNAYKLKLPKSLMIHPIVNVSQLKEFNDPKDDDLSHPTNEEPPPVIGNRGEDGAEYFVDEILTHKKGRNGILYYKVKWEGYSLDDATWEPEGNLKGCPDRI
jgi:hypothetical protein